MISCEDIDHDTKHITVILITYLRILNYVSFRDRKCGYNWYTPTIFVGSFLNSFIGPFCYHTSNENKSFVLKKRLS